MMGVTMGKRSDMDQAKNASENAKKHLEQFRRALTHLGREMQHDLTGTSMRCEFFALLTASWMESLWTGMCSRQSTGQKVVFVGLLHW